MYEVERLATLNMLTDVRLSRSEMFKIFHCSVKKREILIPRSGTRVLALSQLLDISPPLIEY
jgi:hypothetical protein